MEKFAKTQRRLRRSISTFCMLPAIGLSLPLILVFGLLTAAQADSVGVLIESPLTNSSFKNGPLYIRINQLAIDSKCAVAHDPASSGKISVQVQRYWNDKKWQNFWAHDGDLFPGSGKDLWPEKGWGPTGVKNVPFSTSGNFRIRARSQAPDCMANTDWVLFSTETQSASTKAANIDTITVPSGPQPDLEIVKFWVVSNTTTNGEMLTFVWRIRNNGGYSAPSSSMNIACTTKTTAPCPALLNPHTASALSVDGVTTVSITWPKWQFASQGEPVRFDFAAKIDPTDKITEANEFNNELKTNFDSISYFPAADSKESIASIVSSKSAQEAASTQQYPKVSVPPSQQQISIGENPKTQPVTADSGTDTSTRTIGEGDLTANPQGSDLIVDKFWLESAQSGDEQIWYFNWRIRNMGNRKSGASQTFISCTKVTEIPCPALSNPYSIPPLNQHQENETDGSLILSAAVISVPWPKSEFAAGNVPVRFKFKATADSGGAVYELVESNNVMVSEFDSLQSAVAQGGRAQRATKVPQGTQFGGRVDEIIGTQSGQSEPASVDSARPGPDLSLSARRLTPVGSGTESSGKGPDPSFAARRIPPLSAAKTDTRDGDAPKGPFGSAKLRQQLSGSQAMAIISPRSGEVVEGDLNLRVRGGDTAADFAVSYQRRKGRTWQGHRLRGFDRMRSRSTTLIVPRQRFGDGGRWRVCVHAIEEACSANQWSEFGFSERAGLEPANRSKSGDRIQAADPALVGKPQEGTRRQATEPGAMRVPTINEEPRETSPSRAKSPTAVDNPTAIIPRVRQ
jgi:hypothetical protein